MPHADSLILTLVGGFVLAFVFGMLAHRLKLSPLVGYLVAGAIVGPHVLGLVGDAESKMGFAELGITFLLFIVGLELNPSRLWRMRREIFGLGLIQVVVCGAAITAIRMQVRPVASFSSASPSRMCIKRAGTGTRAETAATDTASVGDRTAASANATASGIPGISQWMT